MMNKLRGLDPEAVATAAFALNSFSDAGSVQAQLEAPLEKKSGLRYGAPGGAGRRLVYFIDDLNMPAVDKYGTQSAVELARQLVSGGGKGRGGRGREGGGSVRRRELLSKFVFFWGGGGRRRGVDKHGMPRVVLRRASSPPKKTPAHTQKNARRVVPPPPLGAFFVCGGVDYCPCLFVCLFFGGRGRVATNNPQPTAQLILRDAPSPSKKSKHHNTHAASHMHC